MDDKTITGVVLAGGRGSRVGGEDKGLIELWGRPLIAHVLERITPQVDKTLISANRNQEAYANFGYPVIGDDLGEYWGPLAGIATSLNQADTDYVLTVPCDTPCLPSDLCQRMMEALKANKGGLCVAHDGKRMQNTVALIPCTLADDLTAYLKGGERKAEIWLKSHQAVLVDFSYEVFVFNNINTQEELARLEARGRC